MAGNYGILSLQGKPFSKMTGVNKELSSMLWPDIEGSFIAGNVLCIWVKFSVLMSLQVWPTSSSLKCPYFWQQNRHPTADWVFAHYQSTRFDQGQCCSWLYNPIVLQVLFKLLSISIELVVNSWTIHAVLQEVAGCVLITLSKGLQCNY